MGQSFEQQKLIDQSAQIVYTNPDEAIKIANHILRKSTSTTENVEAKYLIALGNYVKGQYEEALQNAFEVKETSPIVVYKNDQLISEILNFLQLNEAAQAFLEKFSQAQIIPSQNKNQSRDELERKVFLIKEKLDEARSELKLENKEKILLEAQKINSFIQKELPGYWEVKSMVLLGDAYFLNQMNDSASVLYLSAISIAQKLENAYLEVDIHEKLARNYLVLEDKIGYQKHNQRWLDLSSKVEKMENSSASFAHNLIDKVNQVKLEKFKASNSRIIYFALFLCVCAVILKTYLYFRNQSKIKTYQSFLSYMQKQENELKVGSQENKTSSLPKEIEAHILEGLEEFEKSKRFVNKDISLVVLASQLNTNTRYLSEVINGHKNKNFNAYINELRITYITDKIKNDSSYRKYKVSYLAEECGFSSHSAFTTVFKSIVGVSPITFIEFVKSETNLQNLETT